MSRHVIYAEHVKPAFDQFKLDLSAARGRRYSQHEALETLINFFRQNAKPEAFPHPTPSKQLNGTT